MTCVSKRSCAMLMSVFFILSLLPGAVHRQLSAGDQSLISMSHGLYGCGGERITWITDKEVERKISKLCKISGGTFSRLCLKPLHNSSSRSCTEASALPVELANRVHKNESGHFFKLNNTSLSLLYACWLLLLDLAAMQNQIQNNNVSR